MKDKKFGDIILELRKSKGLTQQELANKLNITDKAVSKWERGLSYPDITSISTLANTLEVESSYLIDLCKKEDSANPFFNKENNQKLFNLILKAISLAMGIGVIVLNILNEITINNSILLLGFGLFSVSLYLFRKE